MATAQSPQLDGLNSLMHCLPFRTVTGALLLCRFVYHFMVGAVFHFYGGMPMQRYLDYPLHLVAAHYMDAYSRAHAPLYRVDLAEYRACSALII